VYSVGILTLFNVQYRATDTCIDIGAMDGYYYMAGSTAPAGYNYTCNECGASFEAMEDLTKHCRQDHTQSR